MATNPNTVSGTASADSRRFDFGLKKRASFQNWLWGLSIFFTLTILVPTILLPEQPWSSFAVPLLLVYASIVYSGTRLALLALQGQRKLLSLTFWIFTYVWVGVAPLTQLTTGQFLWPGTYSEDTQTHAAFVVLVGLIAYDLGSRMAESRKFRFKNRIVPDGLRLSKRRMYFLGLLAIACSASMVYLLPDIGMLFEPSEIFQQEIMASFSKTGLLIISAFLHVPVFVALLLIWWMWLNRKEFGVARSERTWLAMFLLLLVLVNIVLTNPINSPRYLVGTIVLSFAFMTLRWSTRQSMGLWIAGLLTALMVLFPYADLFRWGDPELEVQSVTNQLAVSGDYDSFQQLMNTLEFVSDYGITLGFQLLGVLFFWIPRSIWVSKPNTSGEVVAEYSGYVSTNLTSPLWAEAFINAGLIGVIVGFFAYGTFTSALQRAYLERSSSYSLLNVLVPLLAAYQIFFIRGTLLSAFTYLVPIVGYLFLAASRTPHPSKRTPRLLSRRRIALRSTRERNRV